MNVLSKEKIGAGLKTVPAWKKSRQLIHRAFKFEGFLQAIAFVNKIAGQAQKLNHHPDIDIRFDQVNLKLTTRDAGELTQKDFILAEKCDAIFLRLQP